MKIFLIDLYNFFFKAENKKVEINSSNYGFCNGIIFGLGLGLIFQQYLLSQALLAFALFIFAMVFFKSLPDKYRQRREKDLR